jgi:hypothetical protein
MSLLLVLFAALGVSRMWARWFLRLWALGWALGWALSGGLWMFCPMSVCHRGVLYRGTCGRRRSEARVTWSVHTCLMGILLCFFSSYLSAERCWCLLCVAIVSNYVFRGSPLWFVFSGTCCGGVMVAPVECHREQRYNDHLHPKKTHQAPPCCIWS